MKKIKLLRVAAVTVLGLSLGAGVASATPGGGDIFETGPGSKNIVRFERDRRVEVRNNNDVRVTNHTAQHATSGDAKVSHNTRGGDAITGDASNENLTRVDARIDNSFSSEAAFHGGGSGHSLGGSIELTGPDSFNKVSSLEKENISVHNNNNVNVTNETNQTARSGDARVTDNTKGGDAITGDASNFNQTDVRLDITN
jgi:hypothetical protein